MQFFKRTFFSRESKCSPDEKDLPQKIETAVQKLREVTANLSEEERKPFDHMLDAAYNRYTDDKLNLAIIGEFSCGKSTFINALFRQNLLATATQPTTAVPTYITWDNENNVYDVIVYDEKAIRYVLNNSEDRTAFEQHAKISLPTETEKWIDAVTTNNALRDVISKVEISAPRREEYDGIRLIDTPGVNPGGEETREHVHITQAILRDAADATVVMFPADEVFTASFKEFLQENAAHLLKHSIFLITKADHVRQEKELDELIAFVTHHLTEMGVENPEVQCISAFSALAVYLNVAEEREKPWKDKFEATVGGIFQSLAGRRMSIVSQNIQEVVEQLKRLLQERFVTEKNELQKMQNELESNSPEKMEAECTSIFEAYSQRIQKRKNEYGDEKMLNQVVENAIVENKKYWFKWLDIDDEREEIADRMNEFAEDGIERVGDDLEEYLEKYSKAMLELFDDYRDKLQQCYQRYHMNISTQENVNLKTDETPQISRPNQSVQVKGPTVGRDVGEKFEDVIDSVRDSSSLAEGVLQAGIGTINLAATGIKALVNLLIPINTLRENAKKKIQKALDSNTKSFSENLKKSFETYDNNYMEAVRRFPSDLKDAYRKEFNEARRRYDDGIERTTSRITTVNRQLDTLRSIPNMEQKVSEAMRSKQNSQDTKRQSQTETTRWQEDRKASKTPISREKEWVLEPKTYAIAAMICYMFCALFSLGGIGNSSYYTLLQSAKVGNNGSIAILFGVIEVLMGVALILKNKKGIIAPVAIKLFFMTTGVAANYGLTLPLFLYCVSDVLLIITCIMSNLEKRSIRKIWWIPAAVMLWGVLCAENECGEFAARLLRLGYLSTGDRVFYVIFDVMKVMGVILTGLWLKKDTEKRNEAKEQEEQNEKEKI